MVEHGTDENAQEGPENHTPQPAVPDVHLHTASPQDFRSDFIKNLPALVIILIALFGGGFIKDLPRSGEGYATHPPTASNPAQPSSRGAAISPAFKPFVFLLGAALLGGALVLVVLVIKWATSPSGAGLDLGRNLLGYGPETRFADVAVALSLNIFLTPYVLWILIRLSPKLWWYWDEQAGWWHASGGPGTILSLTAQFASYAVAITSVIWLVRLRDQKRGAEGLWPFWENPTLSPPRNLLSDLLTGLEFYLLFAVPLFLSTHLNLKILEVLGRPPDENILVPTIANETRWWTMVGLGILVVGGAAVAEEFIFRGVLYTALRRYLGKWGGALVSAFLFSAVHMVWANVIPLFILGLLLTWLYERTGRLVAPMALHALNNAVTLFMVKAGGNL